MSHLPQGSGAWREHPDVMLMDARMPVTDGIGAARRICADPGHPPTLVLVLPSLDRDAHGCAALRAGASGFPLKDSPPAELLAAIRALAAGNARHRRRSRVP